MSLFPNVPFAPGVPPIPRNPLAVIPTLVLLKTDLVSLAGGPLNQQWGIFQNSQPVVVADTVASLDYRNDYTVANYPLENGAFASYDKVASPFDIRIRFATGGSLVERQQMILSIELAIASLDLYQVVTPERTYTNVNIVHQDYDRRANKGLGLMTIDVWGQEVRQAAAPAFSSTKAPGGAVRSGTGLVQTTPATPVQHEAAPLVQ